MKLRLTVCLILFFSGIAALAAGAETGSKPELTAESACLMDFTTGKIIWGKNSDTPMAPASTTKILTAIVALESGDLKRKITATPEACKVGGSSLWLTKGETHTLEEMLYGILLSSGNDAAVSVAENLAGSERKFAARMTAKARLIGAKSSVFKNSSGMPMAGHLTTAGDMALITRYALNDPVFSAIVRTKKKKMTRSESDGDRVLVNHNKLLWRYPYADGVKTGYTIQAGKCLVASATRNGQRLIAVVFHSPKMYDDVEALFEYGFSSYQLLEIVSSAEKLGEIKVASGIKEEVPVLPNRPLTVLIPRGGEEKLKVNLELPVSLEAPVERLQTVGELQVQLGEALLEKVPVVTAAEVPKKGPWQRFWDWLAGIFGND